MLSLISLSQALRSHEGCQKPVYVSIGHRISLDTALAVVRCCCIHRVPEPVRQVKYLFLPACLHTPTTLVHFMQCRASFWAIRHP